MIIEPTAKTAAMATPIATIDILCASEIINGGSEIDPRLAFLARAAALLTLVKAEEINLDEAITQLVPAFEGLRSDGIEGSLPNQERWRQVAADAWNDPGWAEAARAYHADRANRRAVVEIEPARLARLRRLLADHISLDRTWHELNEPSAWPTPQSTIETILHCVDERGTAALKEPANIERLRPCDPVAIAQIDTRLKKGNPK
jgi:hypothetical protein